MLRKLYVYSRHKDHDEQTTNVSKVPDAEPDFYFISDHTNKWRQWITQEIRSKWAQRRKVL